MSFESSPTRPRSGRHPVDSERGVGLIIALLMLAVVSAIGSTIIAGNMADLQVSSNYGNRAVAFYAADTGIDVTLRDLRANPSWVAGLIDPSTWQPYDPIPTGVMVNGIPLTSVVAGDVSAGYWNLGGSTTLGEGSYSRQVLLPPVVNLVGGDGTVTFTVRADGAGGLVELAAQRLRAGLEIDVTGYGVWDNAIFADAGPAGNLINGNVAIRGSVHVIGDEANPPTIQFSGTADVRNNYGDAVDHFGATDAAKLPALVPVEHNGEMVESLEAVIRLRNANITLDGSSEIGESDVAGNSIKETMDKIRSDGTVTPAGQVYSDEYGGYDAVGLEFPTLDDPYVAADGSQWNQHRDFLEQRGLLVPVTEISPDVPSFAFADALGNSITWDQAAEELTIQGIVRVAQDLRLGKQHGNPGSRGFEYQGTGTLYAPGEIEIDGPVVPAGDYLTGGNLGLIAGNDVEIDYTAQINVFAAIYAGNLVQVTKQTNIAGAMVSRYFDMGTNVPSVFQVPGLPSNMPPGMPGDQQISIIEGGRVVEWFQER